MTDAENIHQRTATLKATRADWASHAAGCGQCAPGALRDLAGQTCEPGQRLVREIAAAFSALESAKAAAMRGRCR
jgi:hypothetical protein